MHRSLVILSMVSAVVLADAVDPHFDLRAWSGVERAG